MAARAKIMVRAGIHAGGAGMPGNDANVLWRGFRRKRRGHGDTSGDLHDQRLRQFHIRLDYPDAHGKISAGRAVVRTASHRPLFPLVIQ